MAHPCCLCDSECYCNGDWDDVIVCHTPSNCESCGCADEDDTDEWGDDDGEFEDDYNPEPFTTGHNSFGNGGIYTPGDPGL